MDKRIEENRIFHGLIEKTAQELKFGEININVIVTNGKPQVKTLNMTMRRRYKFPPTKNS